VAGRKEGAPTDSIAENEDVLVGGIVRCSGQHAVLARSVNAQQALHVLGVPDTQEQDGSGAKAQEGRGDEGSGKEKQR
jgi:hypothetical protein